MASVSLWFLLKIAFTSEQEKNLTTEAQGAQRNDRRNNDEIEPIDKTILRPPPAHPTIIFNIYGENIYKAINTHNHQPHHPTTTLSAFSVKSPAHRLHKAGTELHLVVPELRGPGVAVIHISDAAPCHFFPDVDLAPFREPCQVDVHRADDVGGGGFVDTVEGLDPFHHAADAVECAPDASTINLPGQVAEGMFVLLGVDIGKAPHLCLLLPFREEMDPILEIVRGEFLGGNLVEVVAREVIYLLSQLPHSSSLEREDATWVRPITITKR